MTEPPKAEASAISEASSDNGAPTEDHEAQDPQPTLLEQMGGVYGLLYSAIPVAVFVITNLITGLQPAIWTAVGSAVAIAIWRLVRKDKLMPAVSGLLGVGVAAWIAHRTGSAKGFFLVGIWINLVYGGAFLLSAIVRWPLAGVAWSALNGSGFAWRSQRAALRAYDVATLCWAAVFAARYVVQQWLYDADEVTWLGVVKIAMGYPLTALAVLVTIWAVRRVSKLQREAKETDMAGEDDTPPAAQQPV